MSEPTVSAIVLRDWHMWMPAAMQQNTESTNVPLKQFTQMIEDVATQENKPHLGWVIGTNSNFASLGGVSKVVLGSGTLGKGLHWLCRFSPIIQDATHLKLEVHGEIAKLSYKIIDPNIWHRSQDALYTLGLFANLLKMSAPGIWPHVRVSLEAARTEHNMELYRHIQAPVSFSAHANEIIFPARFLNSRLDGGPAVEYDKIVELTKTLTEKNRQMQVCDRARYQILEGLFESKISQDYVAKELGISTRTLRRKLSSEGVSFQFLLDICRMEVAAREIATSERVSFSQMALKLGYSEHSTFTRAFCRWAGMTPKQYRSIQTQS